MSKFQKGHTINLGRKHSKETRKKMSNSQKGKILTEEHRQNIRKFRLGKKRSLLVKKNISEGLLGRILSKKHRKNISKAHKGIKFSDKHKKKISETLKGIIRPKGENSHSWKGGISFEPYNVDWTKTLRKSIKVRDNYICQLCNKYGNTVHHIDYDKKNCNPKNLITLCKKDNSRVNFNRKYWENYFKILMKIR